MNVVAFKKSRTIKKPIHMPTNTRKTDINNSNSALNTDLGQTLKSLRGKKGYTQHQVATQLGIAHQNISNWECNRSTPNLDTLKELAAFYQVPLENLTCHVPAYLVLFDLQDSKAVYGGESEDYGKDAQNDSVEVVLQNTADAPAQNGERLNDLLLLIIVILLFVSNSISLLGIWIPIGYFLFRCRLPKHHVAMDVLALICLLNNARNLYVLIIHWVNIWDYSVLSLIGLL